MTNIGKIKQLAHDKGISAKYICDKLGLAKTYLIDVERNKRDIPEERMTIIAYLLGTTVAYLRDETDDPSTLEQKFISDNLSEEESRLFKAFVELPSEDRQKVLEYAEMLRDRRNGK